ncbi:MAG: YaaL family protein [Clostridium sp.]|jgi:hypothetical protein|uniref:DUF2508 family protein n=1 Tax=Clostridium sp. TaxID=1506 RepID=UPI0025BDA2E0|nr:DUF2508 family protein [Clostridium sp.]MCH3965432.1 YaaL family protein [Clostridium sp.]MCI1717287.1 YaaL family protein [Clostridium sp.]MCI1801627.1 YaaL family protein [Clostridium sp.]MCI1815473.1 YaaL family protein [Clostridium sp.]MCI1872376.1 YaaL family protein [Clostridium sp.]
MNKRNIFRFLISKSSRYTKNQRKLLNDIEKAREEIERCSAYFDTVKEPHLVDYAIHMEEAAKAKYMYLLNEAKRNGIKVDTKNIFESLQTVKKSS